MAVLEFRFVSRLEFLPYRLRFDDQGAGRFRNNFWPFRLGSRSVLVSILPFRVDLKILRWCRLDIFVGRMHTGHGMPAPPQVQAREPENGRSGWLSQTQRASVASRTPLHHTAPQTLV